MTDKVSLGEGGIAGKKELPMSESTHIAHKLQQNVSAQKLAPNTTGGSTTMQVPPNRGS